MHSVDISLYIQVLSLLLSHNQNVHLAKWVLKRQDALLFVLAGFIEHCKAGLGYKKTETSVGMIWGTLTLAGS